MHEHIPDKEIIKQKLPTAEKRIKTIHKHGHNHKTYILKNLKEVYLK